MILRMLVRFALLVSRGDEKRCQVIFYWISLGQMTLVKQVIMCTNDQKGDLKLRPTKTGTVKIGHGNGKIAFGFNFE